MAWPNALAPHVLPARLARYDAVLNARVKRVRVVLENISDPHNSSACLRTVEAFGLHHLHVIESYNHFRPNKHIDLGTRNWIKVHHHPEPADVQRTLLSENFLILASSLDSSAEDLNALLPKLPADRPIAFVFGNEQRGTSKQMRYAAEHRFIIPMRGFVESFNLSVSVGITLQTCSVFKRLVPDLTEEEKTEQKARWLLNDVKHADLILKKRGVPVPGDF